MSEDSDVDIYDVSDTSAGGGQSDDEEYIGDLVQNIDLIAIEQQLSGQNQDPQVPNMFQTGPQYEIYNKYIPLWMNPSQAFAGTGYPIRHPALRPDDLWLGQGGQWFPASEYAKRYGMDTRAPADNRGRSMLSPNNQDPSLDWTEDFQGRVFHGYTADELKAQGAFDPSMLIDAQLDGLNSPIHPLMHRSNWDQGETEGRTTKEPILWYHLNGRDEKWDVATNDTLWEAMQPAIQLISKVLYSNHPFMQAIHDIGKISPMQKSRIPVKPPPDPRYPADTRVPEEWYGTLSTLHYEIEDRDMYPEAKALRDSGFESVKVVEQILKTYIKFRFEDTEDQQAYAWTAFYWDSKKPAVNFEIRICISPDIFWPLLLPTFSKSEKFVCSANIATVILHELAHCVRSAIAIMTEYENWHTDPALNRRRHPDDDPVEININVLSQLHQHLLRRLGTKIGALRRGVRYPQFFFQNEPRAEEGWAFENQLWGGVPCTLPDLHPNTGYPQVVSWLQEWPYPRQTPRPYHRTNAPQCGELDATGWPDWLLNPPPSMVNRSTALPVTTMTRLFDEDFWSTDVAKFSHQALKFQVHEWEGKPLMSSFFFTYGPSDVLASGFLNRDAWPWLSQAVNMLTDVGEEVLSEYLYNCAIQAAGPDVLRRRVHYERKRWRTADAALDEKADEISQLRAVSQDRLADYQSREPGDQEDHLLGLYFDQARLITAAGLELARIAGWEISSLQYLVSEMARLKDEDRDRVMGQLEPARARLEKKFKPVLGEATKTVEAVLQEVRVLARSSSPEGSSSSSSAGSAHSGSPASTVVPAPAAPVRISAEERSTTVERVLAAYEVLNSTHTMAVRLAEVVDTIREYKTRPEAWAAIHDNFNMLAERSSDRLHRDRVERLAQQRLGELPMDSPVLTVVTACYRILRRTMRRPVEGGQV